MTEELPNYSCDRIDIKSAVNQLIVSSVENERRITIALDRLEQVTQSLAEKIVSDREDKQL